MSYVERTLARILVDAAREFPAVAVTGPRQSGKTTLLRRLFSESHTYVSVEPPDVRAAAVTDPRGFLAAYPPPVIIDEVQYAPGLLPYIKERIDAQRRRRSQYLLTGSQNLLLLEQVSESLAGRVAMLRLLPLSWREIAGDPHRPLTWERERDDGAICPAAPAIWPLIVRGNYPELASEADRTVSLWHSSYLQTYIERDVRQIRRIGDLTQFQLFMRALAARSAQLLNLSDLARDLGLGINTIKQWLSVLEASSQVVIVRPYFANVGKRLVKTPKVFLADTGTLCHLLDLRDPGHAAAGPAAGAVFETAVLQEIVKAIAHRGEEPRIYFWRTAAGTEVDFVVEHRGKLIPIEIKTSATPNPAMARGIHGFRRDMGPKAGPGWIIHPGDVTLPLGEGARAIPFGLL